MLPTITNARYADAAGKRIDMTVQVDGVNGGQPFPFTYDPTDESPVALLVKDALAQNPITPLPYTPPPPDPRTDNQKVDDFFASLARRAGVSTAAFTAELKRLLA